MMSGARGQNGSYFSCQLKALGGMLNLEVQDERGCAGLSFVVRPMWPNRGGFGRRRGPTFPYRRSGGSGVSASARCRFRQTHYRVQRSAAVPHKAGSAAQVRGS
jgi:hypothetical protein